MFLCGSPFLPATGDASTHALGGTEQCVLHLTQALAARGHMVCVTGATQTARRLNGVDFLPAGAPTRAVIAVAINDARLLRGTAGRPCVWLHNEVDLWKEARRGRLRALWQHRPTAVLLSQSQAMHASRLLPFSRIVIIGHGLPEAALAAVARTVPPAPRALFISQPYRGLSRLIGLWRTHIAPACPDALLDAHVGEVDIATYRTLAASAPSISILPRVSNAQMPGLLRQARLVFAPGHRSETFCLAAAEAICAGVPVLTHGIGALGERVDHGRTGFVAPSNKRLAAHARDVLTDDVLWQKLHTNCLATRAGLGWHGVAQTWEKLAHDLDP